LNDENMTQEKLSAEKPRCGLCGKTGKLTRTPCCNNWICDDADQYVAFSYERNSCFRNHTMFTVCGYHGQEGHKGSWQDCALCRGDQPLEMYVHSATNEYNFEKLENPPKFEPTHCARCGVVIGLAMDGYSMNAGQYFCSTCTEGIRPGGRAAIEEFRASMSEPSTPREVKYPIGTLGYYGPTNRLATKLVASVIRKPEGKPDPLHRWITQVGDIRDDRTINEQVAAFFKRHRVTEIAHLDRIIGCPHEEGIDYPEGGKCPHCPYWHDRDRFSQELMPEGGMTPAEILAELSNPNPTRPPKEALTAADIHREALTEPLLRALERAISDPKGTSAGEAMLFTYACYLFAKWRETKAFPLIIRFLSLSDKEADFLGGDTVNQHGSVFLASVCGGDLEPIKQLILNRHADEFHRAAAIDSIAVLVAWQELPHGDASDYFLWLAKEGLEREHSFAWDALAATCADIEALEVFPELRRAYAEDLINPGVIDESELDEIEDGPRGQTMARFREKHHPIKDVAAETAWWQCFKDNPLRDLDRELRYERAHAALQPKPYRAPEKVGRNDPCPCGSGKKYKKCCGK
jgi:hypothetical protein